MLYYAKKYLEERKVSFDPNFDIYRERMEFAAFMEQLYRDQIRNHIINQPIADKTPTQSNVRASKIDSIERISQCVSVINLEARKQRLDDQRTSMTA